MCGRYVIEGTTELSERFQLRSVPPDLFPTWNAAPSQRLPVIIENRDGERELRLMQWGLLPRWKREGQRSIAPINARSETLLEKPMFRTLARRGRCIVPISGFYEWRGEAGRKQPYYITAANGDLWGLAGLYDAPEGDDAASSYTIVTVAANDALRQIHERMPAILQPEDEEEWLSRAEDDAGPVERLLRSYPSAETVSWPVETGVNNVRNNQPDLILPMDTEQQGEPDEL